MLIRKLIADDAEAFRELRMRALESETAAFGESASEFAQLPLDQLRRRLVSDPSNFVFGAFDPQGAMVGTAGFYRNTREKMLHKGTVWTVYVEPSRRGQGIAERLVRAVVEEARRLPGIRSILLTVTATQMAARRVYAKVGFMEIGLEPRALKTDSGYVDDVHMYLLIDDRRDEAGG